MPAFDSAKGDIPWYGLPSNTATLFGNSGTSMQEEGTLYRYAGPSISPGALTVDSVLAVFTLPANAFDGGSLTDLLSGAITTGTSNRGIQIEAVGGFGPTNATNHRIKIIVGATSAVVGQTVSGGTVIADTGNVTTVSVGWSIGAQLYKYGAAGSNTQVAIHQPTQTGAAVSSLLSPQLLTLNESQPIIIAITGNATTATADITLNLAIITGFN